MTSENNKNCQFRGKKVENVDTGIVELSLIAFLTVAATLSETPFSLLYISVEKGLGTIIQRITRKITPTFRTSHSRERRKKREERKGHVILRFLRNCAETRSIDLARAKFPPYSFLTRLIFISLPRIAPATRHSGTPGALGCFLGGKKRNDKTALRDGSHSLLSTDNLTEPDRRVIPVDILPRRAENGLVLLVRIRCIPLIRSCVLLATVRLL